MKLQSKEIFPIEARDKLVEKLGGIDNGVCDIRAALEWAETKCFELKAENEALAQTYLDLNYATNKEIEEKQEKINDLNNELKFARRIILAASDKTENKELYDYVDMLRKEKLV